MEELNFEGRLAYDILVNRVADPVGERWLIACKVSRWIGIDPPPLGNDDAVLAYLNRYKSDYMKARGQHRELQDIILKQAGGVISISLAAWRLGLSDSDVNDMIRIGELIAVQRETEILVPVIQIEDDHVAPGIPALIRQFKSMDIWDLTLWPSENDLTLNWRPIELLKDGERLEDVCHAARAHLDRP